MLRDTLMRSLVAMLIFAGAAAGACAHGKVIPGTSIADTEENRAVLGVIDDYRQKLEQKNVEGVLRHASREYFEDSGTPRADDDYGYDKLHEVMTTRFKRVKAIRYSIEWRKMRITAGRADVEVFLNGAFELESESGDRYRRVNDNWHFVLVKEQGKWRFVSGL